MKTAKILLCEQALPNSKNGSWTQRIEYFLKSKYNNIDAVICGKSEKTIKTTSSFFRLELNPQNRFYRKFFPNKKFQKFTKQLYLLANEHDHLIICIVDNLKLKKEISLLIDKYNLKEKITLLFYNCGYSYFLSQKEHQEFSENLDEIIFLTHSAYLFNKEQYMEFTPEVTVLNNPLNKQIFNNIALEDKNALLKKYNLEGKKVFLWLSHDRRKKGLNVVLNAWKEWSKAKSNVILLIVGANREQKISNVMFLGQVQSELVHEYYKLSHVYLFPTLWKEGFGLSLSQAICSGCFCIAADNGGVPDFMSEKDGVLINEPNIVKNWVSQMEKAYSQINSGWKNENGGNQILNYDEWSIAFANVFQKWENRINQE